MLSAIKEIIKFMRVYRKFWMIPIIFGLIGLGAFLIAIESSAVMPFIYAIF